MMIDFLTALGTTYLLMGVAIDIACVYLMLTDKDFQIDVRRTPLASFCTFCVLPFVWGIAAIAVYLEKKEQ